MPVPPRPAQCCGLLVMLLTQSPGVDRKGLAPLMEPMALRLKRPNRSLLREPIQGKWCSIGESHPVPLVGNEVFSW